MTKIEQKQNGKRKKMAKYECSRCGWVYEPEIGDPVGGIAPGTPFEELPDDWTCPICGVQKGMFKLVE
jgi:rubredoxin